jgi:hypothetical protein
VAQGEGPEFKHQDQKKKKRNCLKNIHISRKHTRTCVYTEYELQVIYTHMQIICTHMYYISSALCMYVYMYVCMSTCMYGLYVCTWCNIHYICMRVQSSLVMNERQVSE